METSCRPIRRDPFENSTYIHPSSFVDKCKLDFPVGTFGDIGDFAGDPRLVLVLEPDTGPFAVDK